MGNSGRRGIMNYVVVHNYLLEVGIAERPAGQLVDALVVFQCNGPHLGHGPRVFPRKQTTMQQGDGQSIPERFSRPRYRRGCTITPAAQRVEDIAEFRLHHWIRHAFARGLPSDAADSLTRGVSPACS